MPTATFSILITPGSVMTTVALVKTSFRTGYARGVPHLLQRRVVEPHQLADTLAAFSRDLAVLVAAELED